MHVRVDGSRLLQLVWGLANIQLQLSAKVARETSGNDKQTIYVLSSLRSRQLTSLLNAPAASWDALAAGTAILCQARGRTAASMYLQLGPMAV